MRSWRAGAEVPEQDVDAPHRAILRASVRACDGDGSLDRGVRVLLVRPQFGVVMRESQRLRAVGVEVPVERFTDRVRRMESGDPPRAVQRVANVVEPEHFTVRGVEEGAALAVEVANLVVRPVLRRPLASIGPANPLKSYMFPAHRGGVAVRALRQRAHGAGWYWTAGRRLDSLPSSLKRLSPELAFEVTRWVAKRTGIMHQGIEQ